MISEYKLQIIRQVMNDLKQNHEANEWNLSSAYFNEHMGFETDSTLRFKDFHSAKQFIIKELIKE